ncbi:peptidase M24, structural domain-containing protein [Blastocladiella britannica]|nr:peptidase M24, structural domain-containing protein [Blastocladiella britannica]
MLPRLWQQARGRAGNGLSNIIGKACAYSTTDRVTQPLPHSHPHIFRSQAELTPGITAAEYALRRDHLAEQLPNGSAAIVVGHPTTFATQKIFNAFQQSTDFYYLTGLDEPDSIAVLERDTSLKNGYRFSLFVENRSQHEVRWSGPATGLDSAKSVFGADHAFPNTTFQDFYRQLCADVAARRGSLYLDPPHQLMSSQMHPVHHAPTLATPPPPPPRAAGPAARTLSASASWLRSTLSPPGTPSTRSLSPLIQAMRAIKSPAELGVMRRAGRISGESFAAVMGRPFDTEHALAARLEYEFKSRGSKGSAYVPVVAGGRNACVLHYVNNDMVMGEQDMVLVDAGGQFGGYASDISRTFPVRGKFSPAQRELYAAVLAVQEECIAISSTAVSLDEIHRRSISLMTCELNKLGFNATEANVSRDLYFHHVGHYLGLDVHDTPSVSRAQNLQPGNVITIEPGVYVPPNSRWPAKYHNIGIRIEDDVAISATGREVLTSSAPKTIEDIEHLWK